MSSLFSLPGFKGCQQLGDIVRHDAPRQPLRDKSCAIGAPSSTKRRMKPPGSASARASASTCTALSFSPCANRTTDCTAITMSSLSCQSFCFRLLALWFHHCQRFGWVALGDEYTRLHERHVILLCQLCSAHPRCPGEGGSLPGCRQYPAGDRCNSFDARFVLPAINMSTAPVASPRANFRRARNTSLKINLSMT